MELTIELLEVERAALYEYDENTSSYLPRYAQGTSVNSLGLLPSQSDHPILQKVFQTQAAAASTDGSKSMGIPLAPGSVACAACLSAGQIIGLLFVASDKEESYQDSQLTVLEILAARAADILSFARQSASQGYLFHKLSLVYQATHAITGTHDLEEAARQTAASLLKATSADICEITLFHEGETNARRYQLSIGKAGTQAVTTTPAGSTPSYPIHKRVLNKMEPAILSINPPLGSARDLALLEKEKILSALIFPLAQRNEALGIVRLLFEKQNRRFNEQDIELAQAIINIGGIGIEDAIHLETAEKRASQLQVLGEIGREMTSNLDLEAALENAMHHIQNVLNAEACVLFLLDEDGEKLNLKASGGRPMRIRDVSIRLEEGIAGWVARNSKPLIVNDVRTNPLYHSTIDGQTGLLTSSVLCVPLETRGDTLGVIQAINHPQGGFSPSDQHMLASVASWAAIAIDNANLFQGIKEERRRLEATLVETEDAVVLTDKDGIIILVNNAASRLFRINSELAVNRPVQEIFLEHSLTELLTMDSSRLPLNTEISTPNERVLYTSISEVTGVGRVAVMQDITALKQIDSMRSQLLGTAAHDLKNPLNAIRLGADLLSDAPLDERQKKALEMMQRATQSMTNLITGLLETIQLESSSNLAFEPCEITRLVQQTIEDLTPLSDARNHQIFFDPPKEELSLKGNPVRLISVLSNLIGNAIKYSDPGARIKVSITWDDESITVGVEDNGPGITEDEIPRVFDHLFRGRNAIRDPNNPVEGTGLGLALSKTVVEQHGGRIWLTSKVDEGSTFYFSLPWEPIPKTGSLRSRM